MKAIRCGSLVSGVLGVLVMIGCGSPTEESASNETKVRSRVQAVSDLGEAEKAIHAAWRKFHYCPNASACIGYPYQPTSEVQLVPGTSSAAAYRRYEESIGYPSVGVYSDLFGAVILPAWKFDAWLALAGQKAEDGSDLFAYIGMPRPDKTFERGLIDRSGTAVTGHIYSRYLIHADEFGAPVGAEVDLGTGMRMQEFEDGEIYWKDGVGAFAMKKGEVLNTWKAEGGHSGPLGFPVAELIEFDESVPVNTGSGTAYLHPQIARFEGGGVYYYPTTGAHAVVGDFLDQFEQRNGGVSGFLGYPISDEAVVAATGDSYIDFQNGILVRHAFSNGTVSVLAFSGFDFYLDKMQGRADDCVLNICGGGEMRPHVRVVTPSGTEINETLPFERSNWDPQVKKRWQLEPQTPMSQWFADVSVQVTDVDETSGDDDMGTVYDYYSIENLWGFDEDQNKEHRKDKLSVWFTLRNNLPFGELPFRQEQWWSFDNFKTPELTYDQYAQTFVDVAARDDWWKDPLNTILYELAFKKIAKNGNCFGMTVESVYSTLGMSAYPQPLAQHLPELPPGDKPSGSTEAQREMINELNVKMGYQLGSDFVAYTLGMFLSGLTHEPSLNFQLSALAHVAGNYPLISISGYWGDRGHSVRPYHWSTTDEGEPLFTHSIKIADPNYPWGAHQDEDIITIEDYLQFSTYKYRDYRGSTWEGARLFFQPLPTYSKQPYTPFGIIGQAVDQLTSLLVGSEATVEQVTDSQGRKLFADGLSGQPASWDDLVRDDAARIPGVMPMPLFDAGEAGESAQFFASQANGATHHYDVGLHTGVEDATIYQAVFTSADLSAAFEVPGTSGKPERVTAHEINGNSTAVSVHVPANSASKNIKMVVTGAEKTRWAELSELAMAPGQTVKVSLKNGGYDVIVENSGPATSANLRVRHGQNNEIVEVGQIEIPSGEREIGFLLPETTLTLANETFGKNDWLIATPTVNLDAFDFSSDEILGIDWSNNNQRTWVTLSGGNVSFPYDTEGESTLWYFATDSDFNAEEAKSYHFKIDTRVPLLEVSTGSGAFTRVDDFVADVTANDPTPGSGITRFEVAVDGTTVVAGEAVDIFWFALGSHTLAGEAEDFAGWITSKSSPFELLATLESLPETIRELQRRNEITNAGVANSLVKKAENALASKNRGNLTPARNQLQALLNELSAQTGKKVSPRGAALLAGDVNYVLASL